jgi:protease secretion system membrane fusion protein
MNQPIVPKPQPLSVPVTGRFAGTLQNDDDFSQALQADTRSVIRLGIWTLIVGFGAFLVWAAFAPLDEGVPVSAVVSIETKRKTIQHLSGGIIEKVVVREGQQVKAGDLLVELNEGTTRANFEAIRQNYMAQRAAESRLLAEVSGHNKIDFHADLKVAEKDPVIQQHITTQAQLFEARKSALASELSAVRENIAALNAQLAGIDQQLQSRKVQADKQAEQLKNLRELANEGYAPKNTVLQMEQTQAELRAMLADLKANRLKTQRAIAEMGMREAQRKQEALKESATQLAEVRREVQAGREKLEASGDELARVKITSPVDGQVVGISIASIGGVVTPGQKLMDIVPDSEGVLLDAKIQPQMVDRVRPGDRADVRFSAFAHSPQLVVEAVVKSISRDAVSEATAMGNVAYYSARVQITPEGLKQLGQHNLQAGMPAEVLIKTGERSLLTYLLHPLMKRVAGAMTEE